MLGGRPRPIARHREGESIATSIRTVGIFRTPAACHIIFTSCSTLATANFL